MARPFVTHHNALDIDLYLRIAPELYLKRLVVGGLEKVYEINRNFRNEGISAMHNPEFTMLEFYTAYLDVDAAVIASPRRSSRPRCSGWRGSGRSSSRSARSRSRRPFARAHHEGGGAARGRRGGDWHLALGDLDDPARLRAWAASDVLKRRRNAKGAGLGPERYAGLSHGKLIAQLFEDLAEHTYWDPTFITDYPTEVSPLSKARPDDPTTTERFELFVAGMEIANGFSELNDPLEQRDRFLQQLGERAKGDDEAHQMDDDYVRALGHGMPPTGGCGVGIDRLDHDPHELSVDPRRDPVPAHATGERPVATPCPSSCWIALRYLTARAEAGLHLRDLRDLRAGRGGGRDGADGGARPHDRPAARDPVADPGRHRPHQHLPQPERAPSTTTATWSTQVRQGCRASWAPRRPSTARAS